MRIGILRAGRVPDALAQHGDYDAMFRRLLDGRGFAFRSWAALEGDLPSAPDQMDGWLITGSRHGVYEDLDWIAPLEGFVRGAYDAGVPVVGICFGHQLLARALGGQVRKFAGGWSVALTPHDDGSQLMTWHQDQVIAPPPGAVTLASTGHCRHAVLAYGDRALGIQAHPEYGPDFLDGLLALRAGALPPGLAEAARARLRDAPPDQARYADMIAEFFHRDRSHDAHHLPRGQGRSAAAPA